MLDVSDVYLENSNFWRKHEHRYFYQPNRKNHAVEDRSAGIGYLEDLPLARCFLCRTSPLCDFVERSQHARIRAGQCECN